MQGDKDLKLFFTRAGERLDVLSALGIHKSGRNFVGLVTCPLLSEVYDVEQQTTVVFFGPVSRDRRCSKSFALPIPTTWPRRWRSGC